MHLSKKNLSSAKKGFWETLPKLKIRTFANMYQEKQIKPGNKKTQTISADRELFGRLVLAARTRDIDLLEVLKYELSAVPFSLFHTDGSFQKTDKSILHAELEMEVEVVSKLTPTDEHTKSALIVDGMATIQMVKSGGSVTFGEMADKYWEIFTTPLKQGYDRMDSF